MEETKSVPTKRIAIIVSGPESSGNKVLRNIFIDSGFIDVSECAYIKDVQLDFIGESKIVWLRSAPHARQFPDYILMADILRNKGYQVYCLVPLRDWHFTIESQLDRQHTTSIQESLRNLIRCYCQIFNSLVLANIRFAPILYPDLCESPVECIKRVLALLGLGDIEIQCKRLMTNRDRQRLNKWPEFELFPIPSNTTSGGITSIEESLQVQCHQIDDTVLRECS